MSALACGSIPWFAKRLLIAGVPVGYVATLLGHSKVATTERSYSKWIVERQSVVDSVVRATWNGHVQGT